jgi:hypothetical protein
MMLMLKSSLQALVFLRRLPQAGRFRRPHRASNNARDRVTSSQLNLLWHKVAEQRASAPRGDGPVARQRAKYNYDGPKHEWTQRMNEQ